MTTVPIRIILQGLIALVPQLDPSGAKMTALLVNARNKPPEMTCFAEHKPTITFPTSSQDCRKCTGSEYDDGKCTCPLNRHEITILPQPDPGVAAGDNQEHGSLPFDDTEASSIWYIASFSRLLGLSLDPSVRPGSTAVPLPALVARFSFPFNTAASCGFVTRREEVADYVHSLGMRALEKEETVGEVNQAMARRVEATTTVQVDTSVSNALKLRLTLLPGEAPDPRYPLDFELPANLQEVDVFLSNERDHFMIPDQLCDDGIGRDFAFFYDLVDAASRPPWKDRKIPHVKYRLSKSNMDLILPPSSTLCLPRSKATMSRPICPMASF